DTEEYQTVAPTSPKTPGTQGFASTGPPAGGSTKLPASGPPITGKDFNEADPDSRWATQASPPPEHHGRAQPGDAGYTILGELGGGAMRVAYKALNERLKRIVALKMVRVGPSTTTSDLTRFHAEAQAVAHLHHPNIVQIYEIGQQDGLPFLALEFVTGGTLQD